LGAKIRVGGQVADSKGDLPAPTEALPFQSNFSQKTPLATVTVPDAAVYSNAIFLSVFPPSRGSGKSATSQVTPATTNATPAPAPTAAPAAAGAPAETEQDKKLREMQERLNRRSNQGKQ
jgi:hypothetical protein